MHIEIDLLPRPPPLFGGDSFPSVAEWSRWARGGHWPCDPIGPYHHDGRDDFGNPSALARMISPRAPRATKGEENLQGGSLRPCPRPFGAPLRDRPCAHRAAPAIPVAPPIGARRARAGAGPGPSVGGGGPGGGRPSDGPGPTIARQGPCAHRPYGGRLIPQGPGRPGRVPPSRRGRRPKTPGDGGLSYRSPGGF
jgi:hypothetical protein